MSFFIYVFAYQPSSCEELLSRQRLAGIDIALKEKRPYGRPKQEIDKVFVDVYLKWKDGEITAKKAMQFLNMKPNTFYRRVKEYEEK